MSSEGHSKVVADQQKDRRKERLPISLPL